MYSEYYQAHLLKKKTWFLSAAIRNENNVALARAIEGKNNIFEFFVPKDQEEQFLYLMQALQEKGIVLSLEKKPNRLKKETNDDSRKY